jgi:hypothetical protein
MPRRRRRRSSIQEMVSHPSELYVSMVLCKKTTLKEQTSFVQGHPSFLNATHAMLLSTI